MDLNQARLVLWELEQRKQRKTKQYQFFDNDFTKQKAFILDESPLLSALCTRRAGKCLSGSQLVSTPSGFKRMDSLKIGESIYAYNGGSIIETNITDVFYQGEKTVFDLVCRGKTIATCTEDHKFLTFDIRTKKESVLSVKDFTHTTKIILARPLRDKGINEPHAYAIGALLGDGCSVQGVNTIHISSENDYVPSKVSEVLGCLYKKQNINNCTYVLHGGLKDGYQYNKVHCNYYDSWCKGRKAHEKICDIEVIKKWDRVSKLSLLAGIIDTDGSAYLFGNRLSITVSMQSYSVIEAVKYLFKDLWLIDLNITADKRDKYKNGFVYNIRVSNNPEALLALKELDKFIVSQQKKLKEEYLFLSTQKPLDRIGIKLRNPRIEECYDLQIDTEDHLFILDSGAVTHNSYGAGLKVHHVLFNKHPGSTALYIGLTKDSARRILWHNVVKEINRNFNLNGHPNESMLTMTYPNGSMFQLVGADAKPDEMEKFLGGKYSIVIIDESGSFRQDVRKLVYDNLEPATADYDGQICMVGTPSQFVKCFFADVTQGKEKGWVNHVWNTYDNPHMTDKWRKQEDRILQRNPEIIHTPGYKRNRLAQWVIDENEFVYKASRAKNGIDVLPGDPNHYVNVIGVDLGYEDPTAFVVCGYADHDPNLYVRETYKRSHMIISDVAAKLKDLIAQYNPVKIVVDNASKQAVEELKIRYGLPLTAAEKHGKVDFIELMNSDFICGRIKILNSCNELFDEYENLVWDDTSDKKVEHPACDNHLSDSHLYAWRYCRNFLNKRESVEHKSEEQKIDDWFEEQANRIIEEQNLMEDF